MRHRQAPPGPPPRSRRTSVVAGLVLGVAALGTGGHLMLQPAQVVAVDAGSLQDVAGSRAPSSTTAPATGPTTGPTTEVDEGSVRVTGAAPLKVTVVPVLSRHGQEPVRMSVPAAGVTTDVRPVGVDARGVLDVPEDPQVVGWWAAGAAAGAAAGNVVLAGHVDTAAGVGAMRQLVDLPMDSLVEIADDTGVTTRYRVVGRESFGK